MQAKRYIISGKVQGVFYRKSTKLTADQLKVIGWVRNLEDGRVEAYAIDSSQQLQLFENFLHQGPPKSYVDDVFITEADIITDYISFEILE